MPDPGVIVLQGDPGLGAAAIEQAQEYTIGDRRDDREVRATVARGRSKRKSASG
jgi:hypothetical protein